MEPTPEMEKFRAMCQEAAERQLAVTDGFLRAFMEATGLRPDECEMVTTVSNSSDFVTGSHTLTEKTWFQRRR